MPPTHPSQADVAAAYRTLIAHETEPKEQDFYRTRLQRLELRTEPESDDFVTQLAVKQIEGEAAWWRSIDFDRNASRTFESMTGDSQQAVRTGVERVLAHLATAGRLIPAGGMALTAEHVEKVRAAREELRGYRNFTGYGRSHVNRLIAAVDALFPATEPAEDAKPCGSNSVTLGWCKLTARHEGLHTNGTYLWGTASEPDPPALAEPAEEETKAECLYCDLLCGPHEAHKDWTPLPAHFLAPVSSPVVPAPTETGPTIDREDRADLRKLADAVVSASDLAHGILGMLDGMDDNDEIHAAPAETEWQTWDAVPDHKPYHGTTENGLLTETTWVNESGVRRAQRPSVYVTEFGDYADYEMHNFAPFVAAAEEG